MNNPLTNSSLANKPLGRHLVAYSKQYLAVLMILVIFAVGEIAIGSFFTPTMILMTIKFASIISLLGLGQMLIIASGGDIDLSVGFNATFVAVIAAGFMDGQNSGLFAAIIIAIVLGGFIGLLNGLITVLLKLPSLVVTLAMALVVQGAINVYAAGMSITGRPSPLLNQLAAKMTGIFPNILFLLIVVTIITVFLLNKTRIGTLIRACGANPVTAYRSGINVPRVRILSFVACGVIAGFVGLLLMGAAGQIFKDLGSTYVMPSIAAVIVGGIPLKGGQTNFIGVIIGAIVLQTITNLFVAFGWGDGGKWLGYGLVLLLVLIAYIREKVSR